VSCSSHKNLQTLPDLSNSYIHERPAQAEFLRKSKLSTRVSNIYIKGSPAESRTPKNWNPTGRSTAAAPPLLSSSSILPSASSH